MSSERERERKRGKDKTNETEKPGRKERNSHAPHRKPEGDALDGVEERQEGHGRELVAEGQQNGLSFFFFFFFSRFFFSRRKEEKM